MVDISESTIVGPSILINGNLQGDEDLTVLGRVEGSITLSKTIHIEESGIVKAEISVRNAVVSGVVVGNITASDSVEITEAGRMVGDIRAPRVIIVEGARFRGAVDMGDLEAPRASGALPARSIDKSSLPRATGAAVAATRPSALVRRSAPPTPPPKRSEAKSEAKGEAKAEVRGETKPVATAKALPSPAAKPAAATPPRSPAAAPAAKSVPAPQSAPIAAAKKLKKKVVVKKKIG